MEDSQKRFLEWLTRFARVSPSLLKTFKRFRFTEEELLRLKPQVEARYTLKKEFLKRHNKEA